VFFFSSEQQHLFTTNLTIASYCGGPSVSGGLACGTLLLIRYDFYISAVNLI